MVNAGQNRRHHQVRVGIGTGHAVFDTHSIAAAGRHTDRNGTIVQAPAWRVRHIKLGTEATVGVDVRAEEGHRRRHGFQHATNGMAQGFTLLGIITGEDVLAGFLVQQ
ncbi:hypothetical protein D3C79_957870 [compost metagenome]